MLQGRPVTIRTCDLGADKFTHLSGEYDERNPFLGCRSIRFSLQHIGLFKTQLRAILQGLGPRAHAGHVPADHEPQGTAAGQDAPRTTSARTWRKRASSSTPT